MNPFNNYNPVLDSNMNGYNPIYPQNPIIGAANSILGGINPNR